MNNKLQDKINRLRRAVADMHSMPAPEGMDAPMMDMNRDVNTDRCPDGSVPGPMGCPLPDGVGCCMQQAGNIQFPIGMKTEKECNDAGGVYLGDGVECPEGLLKNLIRILEDSLPKAKTQSPLAEPESPFIS